MADSINDKVDVSEKGGCCGNKLLEDSGLAAPEKQTADGAADKAIANPRNSGEIIPDRYIVRLKGQPLGAKADVNNIAQDKIEKTAQKIGLPRSGPDVTVYKHALYGFAAKLSPQQIAQLQNDPDVASIEPDRKVFLDPRTVGKPATQTSSEMPAGIQRVEADKSPTASKGNVDVDIAVIDTGVNLKHSDLNVVDNVSFVEGVTSGDDDNGHGSHVAGTIGAKADGKGVVGVAPGARLWAVKVLDGDGSGTLSSVAAGIDYVTKNASKIEVANMSLGGRFKSQAIDDALSAAVDSGVTIVVAAGNSGMDAESFSPANHPKVLAVSAVADSDGKGGGKGGSVDWEQDDKLASFSNYGEKVRIAAPGVGVQSTWKAEGTNTDTFNSISGTSMASPHVAGAAGLVKAQNPNMKPAEVYDKLIKEGKAQNDPDYGFTGDRDKFPEPMLNVSKL